MKHKREGDGLMRLTQETDRLYLHTRTTCVVSDPGWSRQIAIEKQNSDSTVVLEPVGKEGGSAARFRR